MNKRHCQLVAKEVLCNEDSENWYHANFGTIRVKRTGISSGHIGHICDANNE